MTDQEITSLESLTYETFEPHVGSTFSIHFEDGRIIELKLVEAMLRGKDKPARATRQAFSLFFRGPGDVMLQQHMYPLRHEQLGILQLFIVPVGRQEDAFEYEAVFA